MVAVEQLAHWQRLATTRCPARTSATSRPSSIQSCEQLLAGR